MLQYWCNPRKSLNGTMYHCSSHASSLHLQLDDVGSRLYYVLPSHISSVTVHLLLGSWICDTNAHCCISLEQPRFSWAAATWARDPEALSPLFVLTSTDFFFYLFILFWLPLYFSLLYLSWDTQRHACDQGPCTAKESQHNASLSRCTQTPDGDESKAPFAYFSSAGHRSMQRGTVRQDQGVKMKK